MSYVQFPGAGGAQPPGFIPYAATGPAGYPGAQPGSPNGPAAPPGMVAIRLADGTPAFVPASQVANGRGPWGGQVPPMISPSATGAGANPNALLQQQMSGYPGQATYGDPYEHTEAKIKRSSKGAKKAKEWEKEQRAREEAEDKLRQQTEMLNAQNPYQRDRRLSVGAGLQAAQSIGDLNRRFNAMAVAPNAPTLQPQMTGGAYQRARGLSVSEVDRDSIGIPAPNPYGSVRTRRVSVSAGSGAVDDFNAKLRTRKMSAAAQNPYGTPGQALSNFYDEAGAAVVGGTTLQTGKSPYVRPGSLPGGWVGADGRMVNPTMTGGQNPVPLAPQVTGGAASLYGNATYGVSPGSRGGRIIVPPAFYRDPDRGQSYTRFTPFAIVWDLNELKQFRPPLPALLVPNDVAHEDWNRCMQDIAQAWSGIFNYNLWNMSDKKSKHRNSFGAASSRVSTVRPSTAVARTVDIWNLSFLHDRGLELVIYRGLERRTGDTAGARNERMKLDVVPPAYQGSISGKKKRRPSVTPISAPRRRGQESDSDSGFDSGTSSLTSSDESSSESEDEDDEDEDDDDEEDAQNPYGHVRYKSTTGTGTTSRRNSMAADPYDRWAKSTKAGWKLIEKGQKLQRKRRRLERRQRRQMMREEPLYSMWMSCRDSH